MNFDLVGVYQRDYEDRVHPDLMTNLVCEAVPAMKRIGFAFREVQAGFVRTHLPLNAESSNQHGTHQALLLGMVGDYTGGLALASLIPGEPILGIHEIEPERGMSLWLTKSQIEYLMPSTEDVTVEASISVDEADTLQKRYHSGKTILEDVEVRFLNPRGRAVARGTFRYYCRKKCTLRPSVQGKPNAMFDHVMKTSAKMVARLRAEENLKEVPLFVDVHAELVAGTQGKVIAERFLAMLPALQRMVAARTHHLDECLRGAIREITQVVFIGAGFDFRMCRHPELRREAIVFEIDLPEMLEERARLEAELGIDANAPRVRRVACDLLADCLAEALLSSGFDPTQPSFFIYEGCSMYFTREQNERLLRSVRRMMESGDAKSVIWMDVVHARVLDGSGASEDVKQFLRGMAKLGEPFIFGVVDDDPIFEACGLRVDSSIPSSRYAAEFPSEVMEQYAFVLARPH
jgi:methyltransferase (TIGR00027 family)